MKSNNKDLVVWITGASSGIGEACAYEYAQQGAKLILTSSSRERLEPVGDKCQQMGVEVCVLPYDFQHLENIESLVQKAWSIFGRIDILYCNAGISQRTHVQDTSMDVVRKIMEINYFAPVSLAKYALPLMLEAGGGKIAVTTSIAGCFGFPLRCAYSSSKFALYGFFESLQAEYGKKGIQVTLVCPGRIRTNISYNALDINGDKHGKMDAGQAKGMLPALAAKKIVKAIAKGKMEVLVGRTELLMVYIKRFFPGLCAKLSSNLTPQ